MSPILFEIPAPSTWATAIIVIALFALGIVLELHDRRRTELPLSVMRLAGIAIIAVVVGLLLSAALARWGPVPVRGWGTMLMLGFAAAMLWLIRDARHQEEFDTDYVLDVTLVILIGAIIGARALSVALNWDHYSANLDQLTRVWAGGLSFHGGLLGGIIGGALLTLRRGISVLRAMDFAAPAIALGYAITRIGCFLNGCCYGAPTESVVGVVFPHLANDGSIGFHLHPAQLYASAASLLIFGILLLLRRRVRLPGHLFGWYLILYSVARFIVEEFRRGATGEVFAPLAPLTQAQTAGIAIVLVVAGLMIWSHARAPADHEKRH